MIVPEVVIEAKRVEACSLKDGEIAFLRNERCVRSRDRTRRNRARCRKSRNPGDAAGQAKRPLAVHCHSRRGTDKTEILSYLGGVRRTRCHGRVDRRVRQETDLIGCELKIHAARWGAKEGGCIERRQSEISLPDRRESSLMTAR